MHGSRDDEGIEREGERRENENVSLHENPRVLTSSNDTGRWKFPINKLNDLVALPKRPAAGQRRAAEVQKSPHRPPSHRTSTKPGGRGVTGAKPAAASKARKDGVVANVGVPHEEKVDVVHPLPQTVLIRRHDFFYLPNAMEGGKVNVSPCVNQTCHQPVIYLLI